MSRTTSDADVKSVLEAMLRAASDKRLQAIYSSSARFSSANIVSPFAEWRTLFLDCWRAGTEVEPPNAGCYSKTTEEYIATVRK